MTSTREELVNKIETAREKMNKSIDVKEDYQIIYSYSVELDELLNQYMVTQS